MSKEDREISEKTITMPYKEYLADLHQSKIDGIGLKKYWKDILVEALSCFSSSYPDRAEYYKHVKNVRDLVNFLDKGEL